jgi:TolB protein
VSVRVSRHRRLLIASAPARPRNGDIVFVSSRSDPELFVRSLTGAGERRLTFGPEHDGDPAVSPDGRTIVFASSEQGRPELVAFDPEGMGQRMLTNDARFEHGPAWSVDGSRLAWVSSVAPCDLTRSAPCDSVVVSDRDGGRVRAIATGRLIFDPAWSNDGGRVAFASGDGRWTRPAARPAGSRAVPGSPPTGRRAGTFSRSRATSAGVRRRTRSAATAAGCAG